MKVVSFAEATGRGVKIGIVDDGLCTTDTGLNRLAGGVRIAFDAGKGLLFDGDYFAISPVSHGTRCAQLIAKRAPGAELYSIKVLDGHGPGHPAALAASFKWAMDNALNLLNISLGTTSDDQLEELRAQCRAAARKGLIIVAATHSLGLVSYPSSFPEVFGVGKDDRYQGFEYGYYPGRKAEFVASGVVLSSGQERSPTRLGVGGSTSFAAARMTGNVAALLELMPRLDFAELKNELGARQTKLTISSIPIHPKPDLTQDEGFMLPNNCRSIRRAAIYLLDRNIEQILANRDQFPFQIDCVVDPIHPSMPGNDAGELYGLPRLGIPVVADLDQVGSESDWLIIGDLSAWERAEGKDCLYPALQWAVEKNKNVISLGPADLRVYRNLGEQVARKQLSFVSAHSMAEDLLRDDATPLEHEIDAPVIGVFGTSFNQGKFATQLALRREFCKEGLVTGLVGANPASVLLDGGAYVPQDSRCPRHASASDQAFHWQIAMSRVFARRPHVLILGTQGFIVPFQLYSRREADKFDLPPDFSLPALAALMGARPDASILVVNSTDTEDHIRRSIATIESLSGEPVIAIVIANKLAHDKLYGYGKTSGRSLPLEELSELKQAYLQTFGLPAYCPFVLEDQQKLAAFVLDSFEVVNEEHAT